MESMKVTLVEIFIEELTLSKSNKNELEKYTSNSSERRSVSIDLTGNILSSEESDHGFRYILATTINLEHEFKISLAYDSYFHVENLHMSNINEEVLSKKFNQYIWPFVIEQVHNITSKMNLQYKITLPPLSVIEDE